MSPTKIHLKRDERLSIRWSDDSETTLSIRALRRACPCAKCKDLKQQMAKTRLVVMQESGEKLAVADAKLVGNYALNVTWADGHNSGIYSFEYLRGLGKP